MNDDFAAPAGELPPLLVMSHGGPTSATSATLSPRVQYWTSRGIAVLDVNYGGSTGYGRPYRERLNGAWGIVDAADCANGARHLVDAGRVDGSRLCITGGSAGGYTTLCALAFGDTFKAGASHYGVGDLEALARDTHKFESRYLDGLIGPYPERRDLYVERSPIHHLDGFDCPVVFFQGLEDEVVPPNQAEAMVAALRAKGVPVAYVTFAGEQHGFRQAENIKRALDGELTFYSRIFGFDLADPTEPLADRQSVDTKTAPSGAVREIVESRRNQASAVAAAVATFLAIWCFSRRARGDRSLSRATARNLSSPPRCSTERRACELIFRFTEEPSASLIRVTWLRLGRNRRRVLLFAWLTLLPVWTALPVNSQRRAIGKSSFTAGLRHSACKMTGLFGSCIPIGAAQFAVKAAIGRFSPFRASVFLSGPDSGIMTPEANQPNNALVNQSSAMIGGVPCRHAGP